MFQTKVIFRRNLNSTFFARWSQPWRERALLAGASTAEDGRSRLFKAPLWMDVPLFDALLPRGDMHPALWSLGAPF